MAFISINNISISLIRASDGETVPICTNRQYDELKSNRSKPDITTYLVNDGDTFFFRVTVRSNFEWSKSNLLETRIKYDHSNVRKAQEFDYPWVARPDVDRQEVTVDLDRCYTWEDDVGEWRSNTTRFLHTKVCRPQERRSGTKACILLTNYFYKNNSPFSAQSLREVALNTLDNSIIGMSLVYSKIIRMTSESWHQGLTNALVNI